MEHNQRENHELPSSKLEFRRKLSRDPDKGFDKFSADGKVLITSLRTALEEAKHRIVRLRDENDQKDDIIEEERNHRIALEEKMEKYLVDLYLNPNVNDELHQRLPRAKKKGQLFRKNEDVDNVALLDSEHDAGSESSDIEVRNHTGHNMLGTSEPAVKSRLEPLVKQQPDNHGTQQTDALNIDDVMTASMAAPQNTQGKTDHLPVSNPNTIPNQSVIPGPYQPGFPSFVGNPKVPYYHMMYPYLQQNPLASSSMASLASSSYMGLPSVTNQGGNQYNSQENQRPNLSANTDPNAEGHNNGQKVAAPMQSFTDMSNPHLHTFFNPVDGTSQETSTQQPPLPQHLNSNTMPVLGSGYVSNHDRSDNVSHITRLLQEVTVLKRENKELKMELMDHKRDLELLKINANEDNGDKNTEAIVALIEEVKRAEKQGERAVSQLIHSANEDRNAALQEMDRVRLKAAKRNVTLSSISQTDGSYVEDTEENEMADSILSSDNEMISSESDEPKLTSLRMEKLLERQREITKKQIASVISQRDDALDKVYRLRKKLSSMKSSEFPSAANQKLQGYWQKLTGLIFGPN